ncbi:Sortase family protein [Modestobacter sp. DSM 44400]|uniref:class F sortase n=1 Tax=Modestobacter sp. DSM 44400 TaxID=1550230 RepID=UPI00089BFA9D|nr:class F sortase [Modestobacter sp. DSM 44400]SDY76033.1 Sortase family protein [Modestobacter sp. DSM 44400]
MAGNTPDQPSYGSHDASGDDSAFLDSELEQADESDAPHRRRRLPAWLLPTVAALVVGLLVGAFFFGGSDEPARSAAAAPSTSVGDTATPAAGALAHMAPVQVDIPAIEVSTSLVNLGLNGDGTLETPVDFTKAGWFTGGNFPGDPQGPPGLIAGHVDDYTGPAVFYRLRDLAVGDEVLVTRADNTVAVFTVTESQQYPKDAFPAERVYAPVSDSELVLITCTGSFDETARSYRDNLVVRTTLNMARSLEETNKRADAGMTAPAGNQPNV